MSSDEKLISYFVRHGQVDGNANGSFRGQNDLPLNSEGTSDANKLQAYFKPLVVGEAYSSDLLRAEDTAKAILDPKGLTASPTSDLRAWDMGYLTGQPKKDHQTELNYYQNNPSEKIPGGESLHDFKRRVQPRIKTALVKGVQSGVPTMVVAHASIIHELSHMIHGDHNAVKVKPGGVVGVFHNGKHFVARPLVRNEKVSKGKNDNFAY